MPKAGVNTKIAESPEKQCKFTWTETDEAGNKVKKQCDRAALAHEHCWTHYQQERRGRPLTPIRKRGLVLLPGNVRVEEETANYLKTRVKKGHAKSVYEATRQAIETGVDTWKKEAAK